MKLLSGLLLALPLSATFAFAQQSPVSPPPPPPPVAEYNPANWKMFTSSEGGFSVSMPGTPALTAEPVDTVAGPIVTHFCVLKTMLGEFAVSYLDLPKVSDEAAVTKWILEGTRKEILDNGAKRLSESDVDLDGILGREMFFEKYGLVIRERIFIVKGRLYVQVLTANPNVAFNNGTPSSNPDDLTELYETASRRFLGSLKIEKRDDVAPLVAQSQTVSGDILEPVAVKKDLYPVGVDAKAEIDEALKVAATEKKRVLLVFGGNWCYDCHVLDQALHAGAAGALVKTSFVIVHVDIGEGDRNGDLLKKYRTTLARGVPVVAVLRSDGQLLYSSGAGEFEAARSMKKKDLLAFLNRWKEKSK